jgi:hypothetical protein
MDETEIGPVFDAAERHAIRTALKRYMEHQRIGTPLLKIRIVKADKPRHREIPLSTLQRFLAGSHHTQEHHVALCHAFASALPYYGQDREFCEIGNALTAFLGTQDDDDAMQAGAWGSLWQHYAGAFSFWEDPPNPGPDSAAPPVPEETPTYGTLTLTAVPQSFYLHARELIDGNSANDSSGFRAAEGVMIAVGNCIYIFLRSSLTRLPKIYYLARNRSLEIELSGNMPFGTKPPRVFEGTSFERVFMGQESGDGLSRSRRIKLTERKAEDAVCAPR